MPPCIGEVQLFRFGEVPFMQSVSSVPRFLGSLAGACFLLAVAGCQSTDTAGVLNFGRDRSDDKPKITAEELRAFCPPASLRAGTAFYNTYTSEGQDDPANLVYQASISDITRACTYQGATMTLNVAVAGRVVPGPAADGGTVTMPIRIVVLQGDEVIYSQLHQHQVPITGGVGATQFVFNDPNVVIPQTGSRNFRVYAGYDEGPPAKQRASAD